MTAKKKKQKPKRHPALAALDIPDHPATIDDYLAFTQGDYDENDPEACEGLHAEAEAELREIFGDEEVDEWVGEWSASE